MKKSWHKPMIDTLDIRLTENGSFPWTKEGTLIFKPDDGAEETILETQS